MKRLSKREKLTGQVGLALMTGMFGVVPVAYGAPVHDAGSSYNTAGLQVNQGAVGTATRGGIKTDVKGGATDNVVAWKDFSVGGKDEVVFDGANKNYLNVVTGAATSQIDGMLSGGKNVYIVNPHGVIFGKSAEVNVGNLYVSTENVAAAVAQRAQMGTSPASVLQAAAPEADVVNLGSIQAAAVQVEGKNIRFLDSDKVTTDGTTANTKVTLNAAGYAHVGNDAGISAGYSGTNLTQNYKLIRTVKNLQDANTAAATTNFMLADNIDMDKQSYTPIGASTAYQGSFDGMFYEVQNLNVNVTGNAGFFGSLNGAKIFNLGLNNATVTGSNYAGGIAGTATGTDFTNVYVEGGTVTGKKYAGGFAGTFANGTIRGSYHTGKVVDSKNSKSAGMVGDIGGAGTTKIVDSYGTGTADLGIFRMCEDGGIVNIDNVYTTNASVVASPGAAVFKGVYTVDTTNNTAKLYPTSTTGDSRNGRTYSGWDISNDGVGNHTWRIYEGVSAPILTAFLKGTTTAEYKYNYFADSTDTTATSDGLKLAGNLSGANDSKDISAIYNAQYLKVADSTGKAAGVKSDVTLTSNATSSDITLNGIRNVNIGGYTTDSTTGKQVAVILPQALISSGQHGYNIVGGNVTVSQRTVQAKSGSFSITKEYDGGADGTAAFGQALTGGGNVSFGGLLAGDDVYLTGITATYDNKNVGTGKGVTITTSGTPSLGGTSADNYSLDPDSLKNLSVTGAITPRTIYVKLKNTSGFDKTYDGTATVTASAAQASTNITIDTSKGTNHDFVTGETGTLDTSNTTVAYNDKHAGSKTISYSNITLSGNNAGNYMLVVADASNAKGYSVLYDGSTQTVGSGTLKAAGTINQREILANSFQVKDAQGNIANGSKTYDGTSTFNSSGYTLVANASSTGNTGVVSGDSINFSIVNGQANFLDKNGNVTSSASSSGLADAAENIGYSITAAAGNNTTSLSDYKLNNKTLSNTDTYTVSGKGTINKRSINVAVVNTNAIDKIYDRTTTVNDAKAAVFGTANGGYVDYASGSAQLTGNDGATMSVSAAYDSKDAGSRTINYTVTINGTAAANYDLDNTGKITDKLLGSATGAHGTISPKNLSSSFAKVTKTYDGTTNATAGAGALNGIISGDTVSLQSGYTAQFHSKNVKGDANGQNWVDYSGLALTGADAGNYTINATAKGDGEIKPLTLTAAAGTFAYTFDPIAKVYDGTTALSNAGSFLKTVTVAGTGDVLKGTVGGKKVDYTENAAGVFASRNSKNSGNQAVGYTLTIKDDGSGNYSVPTGGLQVTTTATGKITPKTVIASIANKAAKNTTKTYDTTTKLIDAQGNTLLGNDVVTLNGLVTSVDSNASTAAYKDKNGVTAKDAYAGAKDVLYTVAITTEDQSNYNIVDSSNQALKNNQLKGTGTISKRALTVTFGDTEKVYDGTAAVAQDAAHIKPTLGNKVADGVALDVTKIVGKYTGRSNNANVGSNLTVTYSNLVGALGAFADNYTIASTGTGKGKITTLGLTNDNFIFDFNTITKEYDGSKNVAYTDRNGKAVTAESFIGDHFVDMDGDKKYTAGVDVLLQGIKATSAQYNSANSNNSASQTVTYTLTLGSNLSNFNTSGLTNITTAKGTTLSYANGVLTAGTKGTITPRTVYVSLNNTPAITKTYDGNKTVKQNVQNIIKQNGLLGTDGTKIDTSAINARYDNADAGNRNVLYDVKLIGGDTSNYQLAGATGANYANGVLTGTGTINKAKLTISFGKAEKDYDTTATVLTNTISPTLHGFVNNESDALDATAIGQITGTYGTWDATKGVQGDPNVKRLAGNAVGDKGVVYTGVKAAFDNYVQRNAGTTARNYELDLDATVAADNTGNTLGGTVADTIYFKEAVAKGKIKPVALAQGDIKEKWTGPITKVYDGTALVNDPTSYYKLEVTKNINGTQQTINVPYKILAENATYNGGKDVSTSGQGVTYKLSGLTAQALGNFDLTQALADTYDISKNGVNATRNSANDPQPPTTAITPRKIQLSLKNPYDSKIYDGTKAASTANVNVSNGILAKDTGVTLSIVGAYDDEDATINPGAASLNGRSITYTFTINNNAKGNYQLSNNSLVADGDIIRRKVYVDFKAGNDKGIDKVYDGTNTVDAALRDASRFDLNANGQDTGVLASEQSIVQLANSINGAYQSQHVKRTAQGKVTTQDVTYSNFNLQGAGSSNYYLTTKDGTGKLKGKGTITPIAVGVAVKNGPVKEYDGTTAVTGTYAKSANIDVDRTKLIGNDTINVGVLDAQYADKNAANGTKGYEYQLNWDNGDYELAAQPASGQSVKTSGKTATLSGTDGTITPRIVKVSLKDSHDAKVYDGTTNAATDNVKVTRGILADDANKVGLSILGAYDSANATVNPDADFVNGRTITYSFTINGDTKGNYQLADNSLTADGDIIRRKVYADFAAGQGTGIDKVYDGTTNVTVPYTSAERFRLAADGQDTGVVAADRGKVQVGGSINGMYASAHVQRDAQGKATAQNVKYTGFDLA
ncbi:filamentous hemagglutinin family N-terminal domain-containing protein, partial [Selenomonas ruminantium]